MTQAATYWSPQLFAHGPGYTSAAVVAFFQHPTLIAVGIGPSERGRGPGPLVLLHTQETFQDAPPAGTHGRLDSELILDLFSHLPQVPLEVRVGRVGESLPKADDLEILACRPSFLTEGTEWMHLTTKKTWSIHAVRFRPDLGDTVPVVTLVAADSPDRWECSFLKFLKVFTYVR